jgi:hypothetical protein
MGDFECDTCNFCGDDAVVAVSGTCAHPARICRSCATWALEQLDAVPNDSPAAPGEEKR